MAEAKFADKRREESPKWIPGWLRDILLTSEPVAGAAQGGVPFAALIKALKGGPGFRAPALRTMEKAMKAGEGRATGWDPLRLDSFGGDPAARTTFARFWAAVSPNTDTAKSNIESLKAQEAHLRGALGEVRPQLTMGGSKFPNLERAAAGQPLSSKGGARGKVEAMSRLLEGAEDLPDNPAIPIDIHALRGVGAAEEHYSELAPVMREALGGGRPGYSRGYDAAAGAYRRGLGEVAPGVPTQVSFPQFWEGSRALFGQGNTAKPAEGIASFLDRLGLSESGRMLDEKALQEALRRGF